MTDSELAEYLGIAHLPRWRWYVTNMSAEKRATYERMKTIEEDIRLWQAGVGPKPTGVILCHEHKRENHGD